VIAIGVALGPDRLVAVLPGGRRLETPETADLRQVFTDLYKTAGVPRAHVHIALVPPLVDLRRVRLPPMQREDRRRVLGRDASRYFVGAREPQVVAIDGALACAVPARLVEEIEAAVSSVGWEIGVVAPAQGAWALTLPDGRHAIPLGGSTGTEWIAVARGRIADRGRLRTSDAQGPDTPIPANIDPYFAAADHVVHARTLALHSESRRTASRRAARRRSMIMLAAAAGCLIGAAVLDYWGLGRELDALRARRASIATQVAAAIQTRDSLTALSEVAGSIGSLETRKPRWSVFFADLADDLPRDAYLSSFESRGDSVLVTGVASDAAGVLHGLEQLPGLAAVHADGPIRQDVTPDGVVREHFRFSGLRTWGGNGGPP